MSTQRKKKVTKKKVTAKASEPEIIEGDETHDEGRPSRKVTEKAVRPKRVPIHKARNVLAVKLPPNTVGRWVKDLPGRIQMFREAGYELVSDAGVMVGDMTVDGATAAGATLHKQGDKDGTQLYLMAINKKDYDADQAEKMRLIDETEKAMDERQHEDGHYGETRVGVSRQRSTKEAYEDDD